MEVENRPRLVAEDGHCHTFRDAGSRQVSDGGPSETVKSFLSEWTGRSSEFASRSP